MKNLARPRRLVLALYLASAAHVTVQQAILGHSNTLSIFRSARVVMQWELLATTRSTPQVDPGSFPPPPSRAGA